MLEGYRLRSQAMDRLANTLQQIPRVMGENRLREKQFDLTSAMTKRKLASQDLSDRLTGLKLEAQEMANEDLKEERKRLNQPWDVGTMLHNIADSKHMLYPVGEDENGQPRVVLDNLLASVGGAKAQYDEKDGKLYAVMPDGTKVTQKHLQRYAPQFTAAMLAYTNPRRTILDEVEQIDHQAQQTGMTPEMAERRKQLQSQMDDPAYLLDAELKNLAVASAVGGPAAQQGIQQIQQRINNYEQAIMKRAETEGKRAEGQALIDLRKKQTELYQSQLEGQILQNKINEKGGRATIADHKERLKSIYNQIEKTREVMNKYDPTHPEGSLGIEGPATISKGQYERLQKTMDGLNQDVANIYYRTLDPKQKTEFIDSQEKVIGQMIDAGATDEQIASYVHANLPPEARVSIASKIGAMAGEPAETPPAAKTATPAPAPKPEPVKEPSVSAQDMAGTKPTKAPTSAEPKADDGRFPETSILGHIQRNPGSYAVNQVKFIARYGVYHPLLKMNPEQAAKEITERGRKSGVPEKTIKADIEWLQEQMRGK